MLGFIGAGNMAGAILQGIVSAGVMPGAEIGIFDLDKARMAALREKLGVRVYDDCDQMMREAEMVLLAVKPNIVAGVLDRQKENLRGKALLSIAAGWTVERLREALAPDTRFLRVMPNTPALAGAGMTAFSLEHTLTDQEAQKAEAMFRALGRLVWVHEYQMDAVVGLSGSGPAYAFLFLEALADGGVLCGLPRAQAMEMAAQTLLGSAKMALETGMHPGALKDMVCSPGGTTIAAVRKLEESGFRAAAMNAVIAAAEKSAELSAK